MLKLSLEKAKLLGLKKVLVTCKEENMGSSKVIENNGGILENIIYNEKEKCNFKRYWINIKILLI